MPVYNQINSELFEGVTVSLVPFHICQNFTDCWLLFMLFLMVAVMIISTVWFNRVNGQWHFFPSNTFPPLSGILFCLSPSFSWHFYSLQFFTKTEQVMHIGNSNVLLSQGNLVCDNLQEGISKFGRDFGHDWVVRGVMLTRNDRVYFLGAFDVRVAVL